MIQTIAKKKISVKAQTFAATGAMAAAVVLPQVLHLLGRYSGIGTALGEVFLPMPLPILTAMPGSAMLPFMMLELFSYGLLAGLLKDVKLPSIVKVLAVQVGGRAIRALAILFAVYVIGSDRIPAAVIINSIRTGMIGIVLQWALIPLILYRVNSVSKEQ